MRMFTGFAPATIWVRLAPLFAKLLALCSVVGAIVAQFSIFSLVLGGMGLLGAAVLGLWGAHYSTGRMVQVGLTETSLQFADGASHTFGSKPLVAMRGVQRDFSYRTEITAIHVPLDGKGSRTLMFMDLVTDDSYGTGAWRKADIRFDPDQNALLQLLQAHVSHDRAKNARYSIRLTGPIGEEWPFGEMVIDGDSVTLMNAGQSRAVSKLSSVRSQAYTFKTSADLYPHFALQLTFEDTGIVLELGAYAVWDHDVPADLPRGDGPYYLIGAAELHRVSALLSR